MKKPAQGGLFGAVNIGGPLRAQPGKNLAGNENEDIQENPYFPTNFKSTKDEKPFINNMIVVGASTNNNEFLRAGFSNFNQKMVNVFAMVIKFILPFQMVNMNIYRELLWLLQL